MLVEVSPNSRRRLLMMALLPVGLVWGCQDRQAPAAPSEPASTEQAARALRQPTSLRAQDSGPSAVVAPSASTVTRIDPATSAATLRATRARIDALTANAADVVAKIEATPPDRVMLLRLDAAFIDARRLLTTDKRLADLGERLTPADQAAARRYSKAVYDALKRRVAAAGKRHRAEKGVR